MKERSTSSRILSLVVFIIMEATAFVMLNSRGTLQGLWLGRVSHWTRAKLWGGSEEVKYYFSLRKQNELLSLENARLTEELKLSRDLYIDSLEKARTRAVRKSSEYSYIPASIIKASRNKQHNYIILNKGSEDGVRPQSGIISSQGIIGIVDAVARHHSYGITFMNTDISISARLGEEGAVGPLVWDGLSSDKAVLKEIPIQYKFEPGDTVWSSGYSSLFPAEIPLGVTGSSKLINGAVNEIQVTLFQDFKSLRFVTIVTNEGSDEISWLETGEEEGGELR